MRWSSFRNYSKSVDRQIFEALKLRINRSGNWATLGLSGRVKSLEKCLPNPPKSPLLSRLEKRRNTHWGKTWKKELFGDVIVSSSRDLSFRSSSVVDLAFSLSDTFSDDGECKEELRNSQLNSHFRGQKKPRQSYNNRFFNINYLKVYMNNKSGSEYIFKTRTLTKHFIIAKPQIPLIEDCF